MSPEMFRQTTSTEIFDKGAKLLQKIAWASAIMPKVKSVSNSHINQFKSHTFNLGIVPFVWITLLWKKKLTNAWKSESKQIRQIAAENIITGAIRKKLLVEQD
jgi:hypothetical protein